MATKNVSPMPSTEIMEQRYKRLVYVSTQQRIAERFNVTNARVSETLHGKSK